MTELNVPPDFIERRPNRELECVKYNSWCLKNGIVPGMYNPFSAERFKKKSFTQNNLRFVRNENRIHVVEVLENHLPLYVIEKYNISTDTYKCGHLECSKDKEKMKMVVEVGDSRYRDEIQEIEFYFCKKSNGLASQFIKEENPTNDFARIFTDPSHTMNWFSKYVAQAYYKKLKEEFYLLAKNKNVLMADLDYIVTENSEKLREEIPFVGENKSSGVLYRANYGSGYIIKDKDGIHTIGFRPFSSIWPNRMQEIMDELIEELMEEKEEKNCVKNFNSKVRNMKSEEFITTFVLERDPEEYTMQNRVETLIRKCAGYVKQRLHGMKNNDYFASVVTKEQYIPEERKEFVTGNSRVRLMEDPKTDLEKIDREFYAVSLAGSSIKNLTDISQENAWKGVAQNNLELEHVYYPEPKKAKSRNNKKRIIKGQSNLIDWL